MKQKLIVFVRAPELGKVKTRLAKAIGDQRALAAYEEMLGRLFVNLQAVAQVELRCTPDDASASLRAWLQPGWQLEPQRAGDLGEKLTRAFDESFKKGFQRVVIIGSDAPEVTRQDVELAWHHLADHEVVLGPAKDGGYWLIGLHKEHPELFEDISWSTDAVLEETLLRARTAGLKVRRLRQLSDVDTISSWKEFLAGLQK